MNREDPFSGDWKLSPEKSQFDPNHRPSNGTMHWEQTSEGYRMTAEKVLGDGRVVEERPTNFILDGKEHATPDLPGWSATMSRLAPNTIEVESKNVGRRVGKASYVVSIDGATMTASVSSVDVQQRPFQTVLVWDRLQGHKIPRP